MCIRDSDQTSFNNMTARLSKQLINGLNLTLEDNYYDYAHSEKPYNTVRGGAYKWWGNFSSETWLTYETSPESRFTEFSTRLDWRTGRKTYLSGKYTRNLIEDMDYFSLSGGQVFPFGGLTATLEVDRDFNISSYPVSYTHLVKQADENEDAHSEEEIKLIIDASQKGGVIDDTESEIIQNAICFSEISAHEIMIPRQEMKCIYQNSSYNEVMEFVKQHKHTRFPLCNGDKDQIIGMIHIRYLLECKNSPHKDILSKIVRNILFVPENKSISEILHAMMKKRIHLAVVVDEYGGTAGLLSLEDILEELVGAIRDEHDDITEEPVKKINDTVCEFDGLYLVEDAYDCLGLP